MTVVIFALFVVLLVLSIPISYALVISGGAAVLFFGEVSSLVIVQRVFSQTQSQLLLAIPFFMLAGELLVAGGLGDRLIRFANQLVGGFTGGIGQVSMSTSLVFSGISGSAVADASGLGSVLIPWQKREKYPANFAAALNASSSTLGVIIPPSIPMIIYSTVSGVSIGALFLAGIVPGLVLAASFMLTCWWVAWRNNYPKLAQEFSWKPFLKDFLATIPALFMPIFILGSVIGGVATVTEVSVVAVFYAIVVSLVIYRDLTVEKLWKAIIRAGTTTGAIMLIIMASSLIGWILTVEQIPIQLTEWFLSVSGSTLLGIAFMNVIMLFVGTFMDMPPAILILGPVFIPLAEAIGLDPIQLGIIMTLNLAIGLFTPPIGTTLYISTTIAGVKIEQAVKALIPFYLAALAVLILVSYVPAFTITW